MILLVILKDLIHSLHYHTRKQRTADLRPRMVLVQIYPLLLITSD